jgi:hypothetical protein
MLILNVIFPVFVYKSDMLGSHISGHIGGHIGFRGDLYIENCFVGLNGQGMVKNIHIDTKIVTLSAIFMELCQF